MKSFIQSITAKCKTHFCTFFFYWKEQTGLKHAREQLFNNSISVHFMTSLSIFLVDLAKVLLPNGRRLLPPPINYNLIVCYGSIKADNSPFVCAGVYRK